MNIPTQTRRALRSQVNVAATGFLLMLGLVIGSGCNETSVYHSGARGASLPGSGSANPGDSSMPAHGSEPAWGQSEAIDAGPMRDMFEFDDLDVSIEGIELRPSTPFLRFETFLITDNPLFQYQVLNEGGRWEDWQTFVPDGSHSGAFAGIVTLESPATALRFISEGVIEYIYFEFFEDVLDLDAHDDAQAHDNDTLLQDDPDYLALADADVLEEEGD